MRYDDGTSMTCKRVIQVCSVYVRGASSYQAVCHMELETVQLGKLLCCLEVQTDAVTWVLGCLGFLACSLSL